MLNQNEQIFTQINKATKIALAFNKHWSGDGVSASLALYLFLKKIGKNVTVLAEPFTHSFAWLPGAEEIKTELPVNRFIISLNTKQTKVAQVKYQTEADFLNFIITPEQGNFSAEDITSQPAGLDYDLIITLNSPDLDSLGQLYFEHTDFFYQTPIINIDHLSANDNYGQINLVNLKAVATTEIVFNLLAEAHRAMIDEDIATCLLCGIIAQTKSFKTNNVTPQALLAVSDLINLGARREEIINQLYRNKNLGVLQLWGKTLAKLNGVLDNKFVWSILEPQDFNQTKTKTTDLLDIIDELIVSLPQAQIIMLVAQAEPAEASLALIYSVKNINCLNLVKEFSPTGTKHLAQINLNQPALELGQQLQKLIQTKLSQLPL